MKTTQQLDSLLAFGVTMRVGDDARALRVMRVALGTASWSERLGHWLGRPCSSEEEEMAASSRKWHQQMRDMEQQYGKK
jgi:hypothetical protein